ncbi:Double-strand-specific pac1 ribonuclease [Neolecta irregularis DAH-3]|uniref:ribonuclease III n=1 Tax=Neolecta irregularis (strain DAH-3) TaxID=1198029 RepID=A0A1U7LW36_NEOID|nr:Double-strand-specific pac1 ribonuclease [Neolecta irregularis DAH-3]|eukprot:OLL26896.1 Double-strand-specific pac1 ribonuclease [Neolecta irregularis DAH-3]
MAKRRRDQTEPYGQLIDPAAEKLKRLKEDEESKTQKVGYNWVDETDSRIIEKVEKLLEILQGLLNAIPNDFSAPKDDAISKNVLAKLRLAETLKTAHRAGDFSFENTSQIPEDAFFATVLPSYLGHTPLTPRKTSSYPPPLPPINNTAIVDQVFTHKSYAADYRDAYDKDIPHNERLEFLGDSYYNHCMTRLVFTKFTTLREGGLSIFRSKLIGNVMAEKFSKLYGFEKKLLLADSCEREGLRSQTKVIADIFEAYIGGLILDSNDGPQIVEKWLYELAKPHIEEYEEKLVTEVIPDSNAKQKLHNLFVGTTARVAYNMISSGIGAQYVFTCCVDGQEFGRGAAMNQKNAKTLAAMKAWKTITESIDIWQDLMQRYQCTSG